MSTTLHETAVGLDAIDTAPAERGLRFVAVRADLMPNEIMSARSAETMRRRALAGLAAVAAVLVLGYGFSWWQTHSARNALAAVQSQSDTLTARTRDFGPLVTAQTQTAATHAELALLMTGDLSWRRMLTMLRAQAPAGTGITQVTGSVTTAAAGGIGVSVTGYSLLNQTGLQQVGTLTLTGTARDKAQVAAYADRLAMMPGLAAPTPTSVTAGSTSGQGGSDVTFTMDVIITSKALGGRFVATAPAVTPTIAPTTASTQTGGN